MTDDELHDLIAADAEAAACADAGDDAGAAVAVAPRLPKEIVSTNIDETSIFRAFADPGEAEEVLTRIEQAGAENPVIKRMLRFMGPGSYGLDAGTPQFRALLDGLAQGGAITQAQADAIKGLAERPGSVDAAQVSRAWARHRPDGRIESE